MRKISDDELREIVANLAISQAKLDEQFEKSKAEDDKRQAEYEARQAKLDEQMDKTDKKLSKVLGGMEKNRWLY